MKDDSNLRYTQSFSDSVLERKRGGSEWSGTTKSSINHQVNSWVKEKRVKILNIEVSYELSDPIMVDAGGETVTERRRYINYVVLYEPVDLEAFEFENATPGRLPDMPIKEGATAPTFEVELHEENGTVRKAHVMAGIFGVPEGQKYSMDDDEAAPIPLYSPDLDLKPLSALFGNVEVKHGSAA